MATLRNPYGEYGTDSWQGPDFGMDVPQGMPDAQDGWSYDPQQGTNVPNPSVIGAPTDEKKAQDTPAPPAPAATDAGMGSADWIRNYYKGRNTNPFDTSVDYWAGKWNEWGKNDPAYFQQRLAQADEFTGVGPNYNWQAAGKADPGNNATGDVVTREPAAASGSSSGGGYSGPAANPQTSKSFEDIMAQLQGLFPNGAYNEKLVNQRSDVARADLERSRKSRTSTNAAALAARGLIGSGPEITAMNRMTEDLQNQENTALGGIRADESSAADARMMQALQLAAGMSEAEAQRTIDSFRAATERGLGESSNDTTRTLGLGNLALGNVRAANDYGLGLGNLGLGRDTLLQNSSTTDVNQLIALLQQLYGGANTSAGGYQ